MVVEVLGQPEKALESSLSGLGKLVVDGKGTLNFEPASQVVFNSTSKGGQVVSLINKANNVLTPVAYIAAEGAIISVIKDQSNCALCKTRTQNDPTLCQSLTDLQQRGGTMNGQAGVTKLCSSTLSNPELKAVVDRILSFTATGEIPAFLGDVLEPTFDSNKLSMHISDLTVDLVSAYDKLYTSDYEDKFDYLKAIRDVTTQYNYQTKVVGRKNVTVSSTGTNAKLWAKLIGNKIEAVGGVGTVTAKAGRNQFLNLVPLLLNVTYEVDIDFKYETDDLGRVKKITGLLHDGPNRRDSDEQRRAKFEKDGNVNDNTVDDGGHMIGARFNGPVEQLNYFPQNTVSNRYGDWKSMEDEWQAVLQRRTTTINGTTVSPPIQVEINPTFIGSSGRPINFDVIYYYNNTLQLPKSISNP